MIRMPTTIRAARLRSLASPACGTRCRPESGHAGGRRRRTEAAGGRLAVGASGRDRRGSSATGPRHRARGVTETRQSHTSLCARGRHLSGGGGGRRERSTPREVDGAHGAGARADKRARSSKQTSIAAGGALHPPSRARARRSAPPPRQARGESGGGGEPTGGSLDTQCRRRIGSSRTAGHRRRDGFERSGLDDLAFRPACYVVLRTIRPKYGGVAAAAEESGAIVRAVRRTSGLA